MPRQTIYTKYKEITEENLIEVLQKAKGVHDVNAGEIDRLLNFDNGEQPIIRSNPKKFRPDIDCRCVDNLAHQISSFWRGYSWSNAITLVQRGQNDGGGATESQGVAMLNECYEAVGVKAKTQDVGRYVEITDIGYTHIDINMEYEDGDSPFTYNSLDPRWAFVVKSRAYLDHRIVLGVTFRKDDDEVTLYTCYTKEWVYEVKNDKIIQIYKNILGVIPIIPWFVNYDGMGVWEHQLSELNNLNLLVSDYSNGVEQNIQAVWHTNDVDFPTEVVTLEDGTTEEVVKKPKNGDWMSTFTSQDGRTPFIKPLTMDYDYDGMLANMKERRNLILEKCHVPVRDGGGNSSTGVAMQNATGYTATEIVADSKQSLMEYCKMQEVKVVLKAIQHSPFVDADSPLMKLKVSDIQPNIKRLKLSEMNTKVNSLATMISHGINGRIAIETSNLFQDPQQVWEDSREMIEKYQDSIFNKQTSNTAEGGEGEKAPNSDRIMSDLSDQVEQSPTLKEQS